MPKEYMSTSSSYSSSYNSGAMNSGLPMTLWAWDPRSMAAKPKSPILTWARCPLTKMLSHLRSRWITGGSWLCKYARPSRIWRTQFLIARMFTVVYLCLYSLSVPEVNISVMKLNVRRSVSIQDAWNRIMEV
nr:hypothetical protein Iba_chr10cCG3660 [Ipomoea batatas]